MTLGPAIPLPGRICVVWCGKTEEDCECYRGQIAAIYDALASQQEPLGAEFDKVWSENVEELYQS